MIRTQKQKIREKYRKIRDAIPESTRKNAAKKIAEKLFQIAQFKNAKTIALYWNTSSEVSTQQILKKIFANGKCAAFPRVVPSKIILRFHKVTNPKKDLIPGTYRILEPRPCLTEVSLKNLDIILVPGIVFDRMGYRLGYGKGFYDMLLKGKNSISLTMANGRLGRPFAIGLTYEKTFVSALPHNKRDVPVNCVISEKRVHWINKNQKR